MTVATDAPPETKQHPDIRANGTLARLDPARPMSLNDVLDVAKVFVQSGYFDGVKAISQAAVKIMAGQEYGFGPFASMSGIYMVGGRPALMANLLAAKITRHGYSYRVRELSEQKCTIEFFAPNGESVGSETFTKDDAKRQGTKNTEKFPKNMLFARCMSNGVRFFCAGAFGGAPAYVPEDFGLEQRADGSYDESAIEAEIVPETHEEPKPMSEPKAEHIAGLRVENVIVAKKSGAKESPAWTLYLVKLSDGREAYTLNEKIATDAKALREAKSVVDIETERNEAKGRDEVVILKAAEVAAQ